MQRRVLAAAIVFLCMNSIAANAQMMPLQDDATWGAHIRITPFIGYLPSVTRHETWAHNSGPGTDNTFLDVDYTIASGSAIGLTAEKTVHGPFNAMLGAMYGSRGSSQFDLTQTDELFQLNGSRFIFVRAGASMNLHEKESDLTMRRLTASAFVAPFYMREMPRAEIGFENDNVFDGSNHFGLNFGATGAIPFAQDKLALQVGIEDYATWWNSGSLSRLADEFFADPTVGATTRVESSVSHQWLLRAGLTYRWR